MVDQFMNRLWHPQHQVSPFHREKDEEEEMGNKVVERAQLDIVQDETITENKW